MASDKQSVYDSTVALTPVEATNLAENIAVYKAQKRPFLSFMSGISAGACIALAFKFIILGLKRLILVSCVTHFITKNLIPVTLGNIVGGAICVGLFQRYLTKSH